MTMEILRVTSLKKLDEILKEANGEVDFFIQLNFGLRSSKSIALTEDGKYSIYNGVDDTYNILSRKELSKSIVGEAIKAKAFYQYKY